MIILMQEQLGTRDELSPAHRQEDAVGARGRRYAPVKLRVARALDHDHTVHWLLEHLLECRGYCSRKHVAASDHSTLLTSMAPGRTAPITPTPTFPMTTPPPDPTYMPPRARSSLRCNPDTQTETK